MGSSRGAGFQPSAGMGRGRNVTVGCWVNIHAAAFQILPVNPGGGQEDEQTEAKSRPREQGRRQRKRMGVCPGGEQLCEGSPWNGSMWGSRGSHDPRWSNGPGLIPQRVGEKIHRGRYGKSRLQSFRRLSAPGLMGGRRRMRDDVGVRWDSGAPNDPRPPVTLDADISVFDGSTSPEMFRLPHSERHIREGLL